VQPAIAHLRKEKDAALRRRHPWVFSGAIAKWTGTPADGDVVAVQAASGESLGFGHFAAGSSIAVRMLTFGTGPQPDEAWWNDRIRAAVEARRRWGLMQAPGQTSCRLVHGEGDGLPGLIVDLYGDCVVVQNHTLGMARSLEITRSAVLEACAGTPIRIYDKSSKALHRSTRQTSTDGWLFGEHVEAAVLAEEQGRTYEVDVVAGQKTGFFLDQRDNRNFVRDHAAGRNVLNVFSYTGGFSVAAFQGGATQVTSLDSSAAAVELARANVIRNGFADEAHAIVQADAMDYLKQGVAGFGCVVLDPPAFAKNHSARHAAVQAYKRINLAALRTMDPGALLFTFSCSQAVDEALFAHTLASAAMDSGREVRVLRRLHQPPDHPVSLAHPEGAYLKGLLLEVVR
jgi:23S rRNA (cytosine1962-C5)-methyltransferase